MKIIKGTELNRTINSLTTYGFNGTGKTKFIETLPHDKGKVLLIDINENGANSLSKESMNWIDIAYLTSVAELEEIFELVESGTYQSVAIDTMTQIGNLFSKEKGSNLNFDELKEMKLIMNTLFREIKNNKSINSLFLFQEREIIEALDDDKTRKLSDLAFYGSFRDDARAESDFVLQHKIVTVKDKEGNSVNKFVMNGVIEPTTAVKVRVANYKPFMIANPTWEKVTKKLEELS